MNPGVTVQALRQAAHAVGSSDHRTALVAIQTAQDALDAAKAHHLAELERTADYELDGASTVTAWARHHLRLDARQTRSLIAADATMRELPAVGEAAVAGQVRLDHVKLFTFGLKHIGHDVVANAEPWLLAVATTHEPVQLRRVVRALRDAVFPDALDEDWINGMAKEDLQISPVPEGCSIAATPLLRWLHSCRGSSRPRPERSSRPPSTHSPSRGRERRPDRCRTTCRRVGPVALLGARSGSTDEQGHPPPAVRHRRCGDVARGHDRRTRQSPTRR